MSKFAENFLEMFELEKKYSTNSSKIVMPTHKAIGEYIAKHGYNVKYEYNYVGLYGEKKVDIAVFDKNNKLLSVVLFKSVRSNYQKNMNNYFEGARGESCLFLDSDDEITVFHLTFIPTLIKKVVKGKIKWEHPSEKSYLNYVNYINLGCIPERVKMSVFYFDIDYENKTIKYVDKPFPDRADTVSEDLDKYIKEFL